MCNAPFSSTTLDDSSAPITEPVFLQVFHQLADSIFGLWSAECCHFSSSDRLWKVNFVDERSQDVGGPFRECLTFMCDELQGASALDLLIPTPMSDSPMAALRGKMGQVSAVAVVHASRDLIVLLLLCVCFFFVC